MSNDKRAADDAEREAFEAARRTIAAKFAHATHFDIEWELWQAALSSRADGGKDSSDARDAERYRWLRERYTGFDFDWMADNDGQNGKQVICFVMSEGMQIGRDINAAIDAAIAGDKK